MRKNKKYAACCFSGGKDSTLALWYAIKSCYDVRYLINFASLKFRRSSFHGVPCELINLQAKLIGIPLLQYFVESDNDSYEKTFNEMLKKLKSLKIKYFICGDIYLEEHPNWIKKQCKKYNLKLVEPLWKKKPEDILEEFIESGFKAKVVSVNAKVLPKNFVGEDLNYEFIKKLQKYRVCLCGENGEYHTFVYDGPIFTHKIEILETEIVYKKTFWSAWFLNIKKYALKSKNYDERKNIIHN
ncbi:MAG: diphthine--ammonia ligase [Endomicrobiia bacterium]